MGSGIEYAIAGVFRIGAADTRREARRHTGNGDVNAAKRAAGLSRRLGKLSKNAQGQARREAKVERRYSL